MEDLFNQIESLHNVIIRGCLITQIVSYRNIYEPLMNEKEYVDEENNNNNNNNNEQLTLFGALPTTEKYKSHRRMLKLWLTQDGIKMIPALEYTTISGLDQVSIGMKLQIQDGMIKRGHVLLNESNTKILGVFPLVNTSIQQPKPVESNAILCENEIFTPPNQKKDEDDFEILLTNTLSMKKQQPQQPNNPTPMKPLDMSSDIVVLLDDDHIPQTHKKKEKQTLPPLLSVSNNNL